MLFSEEEQTQDVTSQTSTYVLVGDNIDKSVNPRHMTVDRQRQSLHYFHRYAALDRVSCMGLRSDERIGDVSALGTSAFLPTTSDSKQLCSNFASLIGRLIVKKLPYFSIFKNCITHHIPHRYSLEMGKKSMVVSIVTYKHVNMYMYMHVTPHRYDQVCYVDSVYQLSCLILCFVVTVVVCLWLQ